MVGSSQFATVDDVAICIIVMAPQEIKNSGGKDTRPGAEYVLTAEELAIFARVLCASGRYLESDRKPQHATYYKDDFVAAHGHRDIVNVADDVAAVADHSDDLLVTDGAVDFRGRPCIKSRTGNWKACWLIFGCEVAERIAFYAVASNLGIYLTNVLGEDVAESATNVNNWCGATYTTPVIGAYIADAYLGRYVTLATFLTGYLLAMILVTMSVTVPSLSPPACPGDPTNTNKLCPPGSSLAHGFFYFALYMMALGAGGIKASVSAFAGDQFDEGDAVEAERKLSFPNWWLVAISIGALTAISIFVYVQDTVGWTWGFGVPTAIVGVGTLAYFLGTPLYRTHALDQSGSSPLIRVVQVVVCVARNWRTPVPAEVGLLNEIVDDREALRPGSGKLLPHTPGLKFLDKAATPSTEYDRTYRFDEVAKPNPWRLCTVTQVEEVKLIVRMLPIWATNMMTYSVVFAQASTLYLNQATTMDRHMGPHFEIPAASMPLFLHLSIIIFLPLYDKYFVRFARRITGDERGLSILQRIGVGQVICIVSVVVAALVEMRRLRLAHSLGIHDNNTTLPMSVFWLLPQHILIGICEVFLSAGQMDFFLDQAPESMRSLGNALFISTMGIGSFIAGLLISVVTKVTWDANGGWIGNNLNESHMDYFFWLIVVLTVINFIAFIYCSYVYSYKVSGHNDVVADGSKFNGCSGSSPGLLGAASSDSSTDEFPSEKMQPHNLQFSDATSPWGYNEELIIRQFVAKLIDTAACFA